MNSNLIESIKEVDNKGRSLSMTNIRHSPRPLRKITQRNNVAKDQNEAKDLYSMWEEDILNRMTTIRKDCKIYNNTVFGGNNVVCCMFGKRSRCFAGHKPSRLFFSFLLINVPGTLFQIIVHSVSLEVDQQDAVRAIALVLQFVSTLAMLVTGLSDPGIIPKNFFSQKALA